MTKPGKGRLLALKDFSAFGFHLSTSSQSEAVDECTLGTSLLLLFFWLVSLFLSDGDGGGSVGNQLVDLEERVGWRKPRKFG